MLERARGQRPELRYLARLALLAAAYYVAARIGLQYATIGHTISLVWPPTGLALAAVVLWGYRYWPGVALGAFLANAATPIPVIAAAGIALGNTLEAVAGAWLLRRTAGPRPELDDLRQVRAFVLFAVVPATMVSAAIGVTSLWASGALGAAMVPAAFGVWWAGDVLGGLVVAPVFLSWAILRPPRQSTRRTLEIALLFLGFVAAAEMGLGRFFGLSVLHRIDYHYLLFPFVIWAALRFGARGASLMTLGVAAEAVWHTVHGGGPFVATAPLATLGAVTSYLAVVSVTGLVLAAAIRWEREEATRALGRSEERFRAATDGSLDAFFLLESVRDHGGRVVDFRVLDLNARAEQLIGRRKPQAVGRPMREFPFLSGEELFARYARVAESRSVLEEEFAVGGESGDLSWTRQQVVPLADGIAVTARDITETKLLEEQVRQGQKMEAMGRMAGGVAHDFNNLLTVVVGTGELAVADPALPAKHRESLEDILRAARRAGELTRQLLAFSRKQVISPVVLDLNTIVINFERLVRRLLLQRVEVITSLDRALAPISADPVHLDQVLMNLAVNARDAMPEGGRLLITTSNVELREPLRHPQGTVPPGRYVRLDVRDTGHGMDEKTLEHLFEPFFTTKPRGQGVGLGLPTIYGIVRQGGGHITVRSAPGRGTTVTIYWPAQITAPTGETTEAPLTGTSRGGTETVLLVEDEASVRGLVRRFLETNGYGVYAAASAGEALALFEAHQDRIALLLTDVIMPGMNGRELADRLVGIKPTLKVVYMSGYAEDELLRAGGLDPGHAFLQKPFTWDRVGAQIRTVLDAVEAP
jgi:PAS domain S-box-containing protein